MKKLNIVAYSGSFQKSSQTNQYLSQIIELLIDSLVCDEINYDLITPRTLPLKMCTGCKHCFYTGNCVLKDDSIFEIKKKILSADLFIFASPTHMHNVTNHCKNLIDRLAYTAHSLEFVGIPTIILATTDSTGATFTSNYLEKVATTFGFNVLNQYLIYNIDKKKSEQIKLAVSCIENYFSNPDGLSVSTNLEKYYQNVKAIAMNLPPERYEVKVLTKNNLMDNLSLTSYIMKKEKWRYTT